MSAPALALQTCADSGWQATADLALRVPVFAGLLLVMGWVGAQRYFPGQRSFVWLHLAMAVWLLGGAFERAAGDLSCKVSLALLVWPAIMAVPALWAAFLHQHIRSHYRGATRRERVVLGLPVALVALLVWSNGLHGLHYGPDTTVGLTAAGQPRTHFDYGPLFYSAAAWNYLLLLASSGLVASAAWRARGAERRQWLAFLFIALVPWGANIAYIGFDITLLGADPTPLSFAVAVVAFAGLIGADRAFQVVPLARGLLFSELRDALLIVDRDGRVMDSNAAAQALAGNPPPPGALLVEWPRVGALLAANLARDGAGSLLELPGIGRVFDLRVHDIGNPPQHIGRLLQLRDVTEQQRLQARIVQTLAERNAQLQQVAGLQTELRELALRDPLTGLLNRRALVERFESHVEREVHARQPLALVLLDIDHFKRVNDAHGHAAGDTVLREFGTVLQAGLRSGDRVFRIGGEEFALLLPGADTADAVRRSNVLRAAVAEHRSAATPQSVTFSAGVAEWPAAGATLDALLHAADGALYRAKSGGRNRVLAAAEENA